MADDLKNYTSKLKIGSTVFYLKDIEAQEAISLLNGAVSVEGSVKNTIRNEAKDATYSITYTYTPTGEAIKVGDWVQVETTWVEVTSENISEYSELTPNNRTATVKTIEQAIQDAANSIGNLTVNGQSPDANMAVTIGAEDIYREGSVTKTVEASLTDAEGAISTLNGTVSTEGSVLKSIKDNAKNATWWTLPQYSQCEQGETAADGTTYYDENGVELNPQPAVGSNVSEYYKLTGYETITIDDKLTSLHQDSLIDSDRIRSLEDTSVTLLGSASAEGSIDYRIKTQAGDATTQLWAGGENTTITGAIQSLQLALDASNRGQFRVVYAVDQANGRITDEEDGPSRAIVYSDLGYIYLVPSDSPDTKSVYTEYIVINTGTEADPVYILEKIGDTELSLEGYATQDWVTANAKNGNYTSAIAATYKVATEYDSEKTYYSDNAGTVADPQPASQTDIDGGTFYEIDTPAVAAKTIAEAIGANTTAISDEVTRATTAENTLSGRIDTLETAGVRTVNNKGVDTGTHNVTITSKEIDHTYGTYDCTEIADQSTVVVGDGKPKWIQDPDTYAYVKVADADLLEGGTYYPYSGKFYERTFTPSETVTVSEAINNLKSDIYDINNGGVVKTINGMEPSASGDAILNASNLDYKSQQNEYDFVYSFVNNMDINRFIDEGSINYLGNTDAEVKSYFATKYGTNSSDVAYPDETYSDPYRLKEYYSDEVVSAYVGRVDDTYAEKGKIYIHNETNDNYYELGGIGTNSQGKQAVILGDTVIDANLLVELISKSFGAIQIERAKTNSHAITIKTVIDRLSTGISSEITRATNAETALDGRIDTLENYVNGETVHSVNGVAATDANSGAITIDSGDLNYKNSSTNYDLVCIVEQSGSPAYLNDLTAIPNINANSIPNYFKNKYKTQNVTWPDPNYSDGSLVSENGHHPLGGYVGQSTDTYAEENVLYIYDRQEEKYYNISGFNDEHEAILSSEITDSDLLSELSSKVAANLSVNRVYSVVSQVTVEDALDDILDRLATMDGATATAITSVGVHSGTGTWAVDSVDTEQLNWIDIVLDTTSASFLASSAN